MLQLCWIHLLILIVFSGIFLVVQLLSCVWLFVTPWTAACQASLSFTISQSLLKLMSVESVMPSSWKVVAEPWKMRGFLASRREEFNLGPEKRLDHSELLCNRVLLKYKRDRESFWHRHQKRAERVPARVQLQQPGIQREGVSGVGERETEAASQFSWTDCLFQAYDSLLYFYKSFRSEVWCFQFPLLQICGLHKSLLPLKRSFCLSDSLICFFSCVLVNTL